MAGRSVNVDLRIKAQDDASKALESVGKALKDLAGAGALAGSGSGNVVKFLETLSKASDNLTATNARLEKSLLSIQKAYDGQSSQLTKANEALQQRKRDAEQLAKAVADLDRIEGTYKTRQAKTFIGPLPNRNAVGSRTPLDKSLRNEFEQTNAIIQKQEATVKSLTERIQQTNEASARIRATQSEVKSVFAQTTAEIEKQRAQLDALAAAERRQAQASAEYRSRQAAQTFYNNRAAPGLASPAVPLNSPRRTEIEAGLSSTFATVLERQAQIEAKITAEQQRQTEELRKQAELASRAVRDRIDNITGVNRTGVAPSLRSQRQVDLERTFAPVFAAEDANATKAAAVAQAEYQAKLKDTSDALAQVRKYARDVAESLDPVAKVTRLVAEEQERLAQAVRIGALSQDQAATALDKYKRNLDGSAAATDRQSREFEQLSTYVQELRRDFDRAGYAEQFLSKETEKLNRAVKAGILSQNEYAKALETVKRKAEQLGEQSNPQLFGLNPYQTQNLLFQFNDIATQLASGTSITQTLAQQGGQILQLFPKVGNSIVSAFAGARVAIVPVVAVLAGLVVSIKSAADQAERLRSFGGLLGAIGTEGSSTAEQLSDTARALDRYGLSAEEAIASTRKLTREGFDATMIREFGKTAKDMADVLGIDVNNAVNLLSDAYTGNIDSLRRLMDETDAFTPAQRQMIEAMYSSGDAAGALDKAFAILSKNMNEGARQARGPWSEAFRNLGNAWDSLIEQLGKTDWAQDALYGIDLLAGALNRLAGSSDAARIAEMERQGVFANPPAPDPLASAVGPYGTYQTAPGKTDRQNSNGTAVQQNNATKLTEEARRQAILAKEVTSQKVIQDKLDVIKIQRQEALGNSVTQQKRDEIIALELATKRAELEKQLATYKKQQADAAEREAKTRASFDFQAKALLRDLESFRSKAYWDVNAYRVGYGSDTVTRADGRVERVTANTTVTRDDAERDLTRRLAEFTNVVKQQIGSERFGQFSPSQQAALVSIAYNYGELPKRIIGAVKEGTNAEIAAAVKGLRNDNGGVNAGRRDREAAILGAENLAVTQGAAQAQKDAQEKLDKFNISLDDKLAKEERSIANQRELIGLQGAELRAAIERQQVAEALAQATDDLRRATGNESANLTQEQVNRITVDVKARLKLDEPAKIAADLQKQVDDLQNFRGTLEARLQEKKNRGDVGGIREVQQQIDELDARIAVAAKNYLDFLNTPGNAEALGLYGAALDNVIAKFTLLSEKTAEWKLTIGSATITATEFANAFTNTATSALDKFAQAVANGKNVFGSLWDAFRQFAADFLLQIARMIQQQIIFNLVSGILKSLVPGAGGFGSASSINATALGSLRSGLVANPNDPLNVGMWHSGGLVGENIAPSYKTISPAVFANAMRYHSGGIAGLKPGEVPSVLMRGEEVLTRDDPRHILNGGGGTGSVKIVNAFDEGEVISKAMETKAGERAILNFVRNNSRAVKSALG